MAGYDSPFDNLARKETFRNRSPYNSNDPFSSKSPYSNKSPYGPEQSPYANKQSPYAKQNEHVNEKEKKKFLRFNDLKILNEFMVHLANNTLPNNSRIDVLSQGLLGEIKNILADRIFKIAIIPALVSIVLALVLALTNNFLIMAIAVLIYLGILVRVFFYPAQLYYSNIRYTTCVPATTFYEEMEYWFKMSVFNTFGSMITVAILLFVGSFFQQDIVNYLIAHLGHVSATSSFAHSFTKYLATISFSISWKVLSIGIFLILFLYSKFVTRAKQINEEIRDSILEEIRNETISSISKIQQDYQK